MTHICRKLIARMAAALLLFSVLSPSIASALFSHRADLMAKVLGVPAPRAAAAAMDHADGCGQMSPAAVMPAHQGDGGSPLGDTTDHAAHGIFCSFCLTASAGVALPGAPPAVVALVAATPVSGPLRHDQVPPLRTPSPQQARAPPSLI